MKVLVTGGAGQLGRSLAAMSVRVASRAELDVGDAAAIEAGLAAHAPTVVINAAAYTAVDAAEADAERAFAVNAVGAGQLAAACAARGIALIHVSTDYVFDGTASAPIDEDAAVSPLNVYGRSKAEGERRVLAAGGTVVRTSWLFATGGAGFVQAIARLAERERELRVVADQLGRPTWATDLAQALLGLASMRNRPPVLHLCGAGPTSWHGFAEAIVATLRRRGPIACERVVPIGSAERASPARRPAYGVLDTRRAEALGLDVPHWRHGLGRVLAGDPP